MVAVKSPQKKSNRGRKSPYDSKVHPDKAKNILLSGATKAEAAKSLGISIATWFNWERDHIEFFDAVKQAAYTADLEVERALFKSATGFVDDEGKKHSPNPTSLIFWLKNRQPENWRDKREVTADVSVEDKSKSDKLDEVLAILRDAG